MNGDFSNGLEGWEAESSIDYTYDINDEQRFVIIPSRAGAYGSVSLAQEMICPEAGTIEFLLSFYHKGMQPINGTIAVSWGTSSLMTEMIVGETGGWSQQRLSVQYTPGTKLYFSLNSEAAVSGLTPTLAIWDIKLTWIEPVEV